MFDKIARSQKRILFVVHTQYSLSLAAGLAKGRFKDTCCDLILFKDFKLSKELEFACVKIFSSFNSTDGLERAKNMSFLARNFLKIKTAFKASKYLKSSYSHVFIVLDMNLAEMYIMKKAKRINKEVSFSSLEDGSFPYFLNYDKPGGFDRNNGSRWVRKILFKYFLRVGRIYSFRGRYMGANNLIHSVYLTFPESAREIYKNHKRIGISENEFNDGLALYSNGQSPLLNDGDFLFVLDKFDVYENPKNVENLISNLSGSLLALGKNIFFKMHPRENYEPKFLELGKCLATDMAVEAVYNNSIGNKVTIVGVKSTALQSAKKLGFRAISLATILTEDNPHLVDFYQRIEVELPADSISILAND